MKVRGIIAEFDHATITLMTPAGDLHSLPLARLDQAPVLGREIEVDVAVKRWSSWAAVLAATAVAAVLALMFTPPFIGPTTALVVVDINPSIELSVTEKQQVRYARGLNEEGKALLSTRPVRGTSLTDAVQALVSAAVEQGVLDPRSGLMAVTAVSLREENPAEPLAAAAQKAAQSTLTGAHVLAFQASLSDTKAAEEKGLTVSGFLAVRTALANGLSLPEADVHSLGLFGALKKHGILPQEVDSVRPELHDGQAEPRVPQTPLPVPAEPLPDLPIPKLPVPKLPMPEVPVPKLPVPEVPVPKLPVPEVPVPNLPEPDLPEPDLPVPELPVSELPLPLVLTDDRPVTGDTPNIIEAPNGSLAEPPVIAPFPDTSADLPAEGQITPRVLLPDQPPGAPGVEVSPPIPPTVKEPALSEELPVAENAEFTPDSETAPIPPEEAAEPSSNFLDVPLREDQPMGAD